MAARRPGAYLKVNKPGQIQADDDVRVVYRPDHRVTVALVFRAITTEPDLLPQLLEAPELPEEIREMAIEGRTFSIG